MLTGPYVIEHAVPLKKTRAPNMPFGQMKIGDSFRVNVEGQADRDATRQRIVRFQHRHFPLRFGMFVDGLAHVRVHRLSDYGPRT